LESNFWEEFWSKHAINADDNPQIHVARTRNKLPINNKLWDYTVQSVIEPLKLNENDRVLDLCSGNGLFAKEFSPLVKSIHCVDISHALIQYIESYNLSNITTQVGSMSSLYLNDNSFEKVLWYAAIQYAKNKEVIEILKNLHKCLVDGGRIYIGDIPDQRKMWSFFNNPDRIGAYFRGIENDVPIIGNWFDHKWLVYLAEFIGFSEVKVLEQDSKLIYSDFRFDLLLTK
jgi:ubiquinone/menaquinone biosynthesis C-methylase UbiE